jgi:predicted phage terminase large subunit-like protein
VEHLLTVVESTMKMPNKHLKLKVELLDWSLAQDSLAEFVKQAWHVVEPKTAIQWNWHLDAICEYLEAVTADDGINRLIINLPPRSGKSILASVMWPAWVWARQPSTRWLCASYSAILANKLSTDRRSVITSPWYQQRWPLQLASDQNQKSEFGNTERGHMIATSVSGSATGRGGDFIVADDLQNPEMAESPAERETVNRFFDETLTTRLDDKRRGRIVVIQQRTHQADLTGHLLEQGGWTQLCLPAEFERRTVIPMPRSGRQVVRLEGELLWLEREGRAELDAAKIRLGSYGYACQYLQNPIARGGNLFKEKWFGRYREIPKFDALVQSWDCAFKTGRTNDYSACVTIGRVNPNREGPTAAPGFYLVDAWRGRVEFPELKRRAQSLYELWHPSVVLIEDTASGQSLLQELQRTMLPIKGLTPDPDKTARANAITPTIENGQFWLLEGAPWLQDYIEEMSGFPGVKHDDLVDATVQALTYLREPEPSILKYYRDRAAAEKAREQNREFLGISAAELAHHRLQAGNCHRCAVSLFMKSSVTDGPGYLCKDCFTSSNSRIA